jgi:hypothetical protein
MTKEQRQIPLARSVSLLCCKPGKDPNNDFIKTNNFSNSPGTSFERQKRADFSQVWCEKFPQKRREYVRILREFFPPKSTKYARFSPAAGELPILYE